MAHDPMARYVYERETRAGRLSDTLRFLIWDNTDRTRYIAQTHEMNVAELIVAALNAQHKQGSHNAS